jgi:hypothetical protein
MQARTGDTKRKGRKIDFTPLAYETDIIKDRDYLLHLPNGETACLSYDDGEGPTLHVVLLPGDKKTFIDTKNMNLYCDAEELR